MIKVPQIFLVSMIYVCVVFGSEQCRVFAEDSSKETQTEKTQKTEPVLSAEELEIIKQLDILENLPLLSEEDFGMFEEEPVVESANK